MDADLNKEACYTATAFANPEDLEKKKGIFERRERTVCLTFDSVFRITYLIKSRHTGRTTISGGKGRYWKKDPYHRQRPFEEPELSDKLLKLARSKPYDAEE